MGETERGNGRERQRDGGERFQRGSYGESEWQREGGRGLQTGVGRFGSREPLADGGSMGKERGLQMGLIGRERWRVTEMNRGRESEILAGEKQSNHRRPAIGSAAGGGGKARAVVPESEKSAGGFPVAPERSVNTERSLHEVSPWIFKSDGGESNLEN